MDEVQEKKVLDDVSMCDLPGLAMVYAEARGQGVEIAQGFFDVYAQFRCGDFVGFRLEFTGT